MSRNIIRAQSETLYVGPTPATGGHYISGATKYFTTGTNYRTLVRQLFRVQNINHSYNLGNLQPVNQMGELAAIDFVTTDAPTVNASFTFLSANMLNEKSLGFSISSGTNLIGALSGILNKTQDEKNYFILTRQEGDDAHNNSAAYRTNEYVTAIGNGYVTNYSAEGAVGGLPTVSVSIEGANLKIDKANLLSDIPAINPAAGTAVTNSHYTIPAAYTNYSGQSTNNLQSISAIRPGDISLTLGYNELGADATDFRLQSYSLQIPLNREAINQLGSKFAFSREIQFPLNATLSVNALVGELQTGNLYDIFNDCNSRSYDATIRLRNPCGNTDLAAYILRGGKFTSQEQTASVGANKAVTLNFQFPIGGPTSTGVNIFFSGISFLDGDAYPLA